MHLTRSVHKAELAGRCSFHYLDSFHQERRLACSSWKNQAVGISICLGHPSPKDRTSSPTPFSAVTTTRPLNIASLLREFHNLERCVEILLTGEHRVEVVRNRLIEINMKGNNEGSSKGHSSTGRLGAKATHTTQPSPTPGADTRIEAEVSILHSTHEM
jgi:hypothetical protein